MKIDNFKPEELKKVNNKLDIKLAKLKKKSSWFNRFKRAFWKVIKVGIKN